MYPNMEVPIDSLVEDCSISIAYALEILQSCSKPLICIDFQNMKIRFDKEKSMVCIEHCHLGMNRLFHFLEYTQLMLTKDYKY